MSSTLILSFRVSCRGEGEPPIYVNVDSRDGSTANTWIDALQVILVKSFSYLERTCLGRVCRRSGAGGRCGGSGLSSRYLLCCLEEIRSAAGAI